MESNTTTTVLTVFIIVVSTSVAESRSEDQCVPALRRVFEFVNAQIAPHVRWEIVDVSVATDKDPHAIAAKVCGLTALSTTDNEPKSRHHSGQKDTHVNDSNPSFVNLVLTAGGTGFSPLDRTPDVLSPYLTRPAPGLVHAMLSASLAITPFACMARPVAGIMNSSVVATLPGSPKAAKENLEAIIKMLPHACLQAMGRDSRSLHSVGIANLERMAGIAPAPGLAPTLTLHSCTEVGSDFERHADQDSPASLPFNTDLAHRLRKSPYPMITVSEALSLIDEHTPDAKEFQKTPDPHMKHSSNVVGLVPMVDLFATENIPADEVSVVDGYAICLPDSGSFAPSVYQVAGATAAKQLTQVTSLHTSRVVRVSTGAVLPRGTFAVVMVEDTILKSTITNDSGRDEENEIEILPSAIPKLVQGANIRAIGSDMPLGSPILPGRPRISGVGGEVGLLAATGLLSTEALGIRRLLKIIVLSTGDELAPHHQPSLQRGQVRDANRPMLLTALANCGFSATDGGIIPDKEADCSRILVQAVENFDVIITTGGASMGEHDFVKSTIAHILSGKIHFGRVAMKPGKPTTFATIPVTSSETQHSSRAPTDRTAIFFGLAGNPASALVTYNVFVLPALHRMIGAFPTGATKIKVKLSSDIQADKESMHTGCGAGSQPRTEYHRARVAVRSDGYLWAQSTGTQRSSRVASMAEANGLLILASPPASGLYSQGCMIDALLIGALASDIC